MKDDQNSNPDDAYGVVTKTYLGLVEALTGIAASEKTDWFLSVGQLMQKVRGKQFLEALMAEIASYREKGRIKDDYLQSEQGFTCLQEILNCIDQDSPDNLRFSALKAIFLNAAQENKSDRDDPLPHRLIQICRQLTSTDVLILRANYEISKAANWREWNGAAKWAEEVAKRSGLKLIDIVFEREKFLIERRLISPNTYKDLSGFMGTNNFRLTDLGATLCEFIGSFEIPYDAAPAPEQ